MSIDEIIEESFRDHSAAIRGRALQLTRDPEAAADVTQEAFLRLFVEARAGRLPDNIRAWLYRTTANLVVSSARHAAVASRFAPRLVRDDEPILPEAVVVLRESQHEVASLLSGLRATDRVALTMSAHGASGREIAHRLGRSDAATRTVLCRAREHLRLVAGASGSPFAA